MTASNMTLIGVDLGGTNVRAGRVENGHLAAVESRAISSHAAQDVVIEEVCQTIETVLQRSVTAIGIGVPSLVDVDTGVVYSVENIPSWKEVPLKQILQDRFKLPIHINNDANCFALGEYHFGQGAGAKNLVGLIIGTGMACGIVAGGRLFAGANCGAGEIGAIPYQGKTLEHFCSGQFFSREYGIDGAALCAKADAGDAQAKEAFTAFGRHLAHAIQTVLYAYDPQLIILGGSVSKAFVHFEPAMREGLKNYAFPHALARLRIISSQTPHIAILGAAALCLDAAT